MLYHVLILLLISRTSDYGTDELREIKKRKKASMQTKQDVEKLLQEADGLAPIPRQNAYLKAIAWLLFILAFKKEK